MILYQDEMNMDVKSEKPDSYFEPPAPYKNAPSCHVNLLELSRYAKKHGVAIKDLSDENIKKFKI